MEGVDLPRTAALHEWPNALLVHIFLADVGAKNMIKSKPAVFAQDYLLSISRVRDALRAAVHELFLNQRARAYCHSHGGTAVVRDRQMML